jgi:hypothetical protein
LAVTDNLNPDENLNSNPDENLNPQPIIPLRFDHSSLNTLINFVIGFRFLKDSSYIHASSIAVYDFEVRSQLFSNPVKMPVRIKGNDKTRIIILDSLIKYAV